MQKYPQLFFIFIACFVVFNFLFFYLIRNINLFTRLTVYNNSVVIYADITTRPILEKHKINEPIDIVYTWVNGSDPEFLKDYQKFSKYETKKIDKDLKRYRDLDQLKYSLRSIELNAPWINHIYIVTNGQVPCWLNQSNEKLSIIKHNEIFHNLSNLPTFSSSAIEVNLHRIPGLSEKFIYFNDDIFLGEPITLDDFYTSNNGYKIYLAWSLPNCISGCSWTSLANGRCNKLCNNTDCQFDGGDCTTNHIIPSYDKKLIKTTGIDSYTLSLLHTNRLINLRYGFVKRYVAAHSPIMINKYIMEELQQEFRKDFDTTERNKFRGIDDMQFGFVYYYYLMSEKYQGDFNDIFQMYDVDKSGIWTDNELETFLTKNQISKFKFNEKLLNCNGSNINQKSLTSSMFANCINLINYFNQKINKYKYEKIQDSKYVKMERLFSNRYKLKSTFKNLKKLTKFLCINDDLDSTKSQENELAKYLLNQFQMNLFPNQSSYELHVDNQTCSYQIRNLLEFENDSISLNSQLYYICLIFLLFCLMFYIIVLAATS